MDLENGDHFKTELPFRIRSLHPLSDQQYLVVALHDQTNNQVGREEGEREREHKREITREREQEIENKRERVKL